MRSSLLILVAGSVAIFLPSVLARSLQKRAAFYIANETACVVDSIVYYNGDPIPTDDPCEACKCRPPGFACVLRECEVKPGCRAVRKAGHCCPDYVCGCEHNGRMYRDGDEIRDSQNPCYTCHCQGSAIACAFVDCFFRVDCAPDYVAGECCPRYDHCTQLGSTANQSSATPSSSSLAPTASSNPDTTIKVEVFTELSLFGLPHLGIDETFDRIDRPQSSSPKPIESSSPQTSSEASSPSVATTLQTFPTTTAKPEPKPDSTAPVFYIPKEEPELTEEKASDEPPKDLEVEVTTPDEKAITDDIPKEDEVETVSGIDDSSAKPELYVNSEESKLSEEISTSTTTLSDQNTSAEPESIKEVIKEDISTEIEAEPEVKISTTISEAVTTLSVSDKTVTDAPATTPIPLLFLNVKVPVEGEEKKQLPEDVMTTETVKEPAITTKIIDELTTITELKTEKIDDLKESSSTSGAPSAIDEETTNVIVATTSKSNRSGKQNGDEDSTDASTTITAPPATTTVSASSKTTTTEKEDEEIQSSTTEKADIKISSTTTEGIQTEGIQTEGEKLELTKGKTPSIYIKTVDDSLSKSINATGLETSTEAKVTEQTATSTEAKVSEQTAASTEASTEQASTEASTEQATTEKDLGSITTASLPLDLQTDQTTRSNTKTTYQETKVEYKD